MAPATSFPRPPEALLAETLPVSGGGLVAPSLDVEAWVRSEILAPNRPLSNYDHAHLVDGQARVAFLWSTEVERRQGRRTLGTCQLAAPKGRAWVAAQRRAQLVGWFGEVPDFLVVLDALFVTHALSTGRTADVLAVVEHELYHAAQDTDREGEPKYTPDGEPVWGIRPHDTEEFAGVVRRYGVSASANAGPLAEAVEYVRENGPDVATATLDGLCGTCRGPIGGLPAEA